MGFVVSLRSITSAQTTNHLLATTKITMETLKINPLLPANAKQELYDFYQFLVGKYVLENQTLNETTEQTQPKNIQTLKGAFSHYADSSKISLENKAWEKHLLNK